MASKPVRIVLVASVAVNLLLVLKIMVWKCTVDSASGPQMHIPKFTLAPPVRVETPVAKDPLDSIIFVGGVPRSGTTLARAMLDAHPDIRCGEETRVVPRIVSMRSKWSKSAKETDRLLEAGLSEDTLDQATKLFIDHIIKNHGEPAPHLCNKDPLLLNHMTELRRMYRSSKFILMIRDGRAVAHSIVVRNVTISGVNNKDHVSAALFWNRSVQRMYADCRSLGKSVCMGVRYEELVKDPGGTMKDILSFLGISWHDNVLHHQDFINKGVSISK